MARHRRIAILLRVADHQAGEKDALQLADGDVSRGKLEVLATGQQVVIGGTHASGGGTPIRWFRGFQNGRTADAGRYPVAAEIPIIRSRKEAGVLLELIEHALTEAGLKVSRKAASAAAARPAETNPADQAPPSADKLVETLDAMPNPADFDDRGKYVEVMRAISGCVRALHSLGRLGPQDSDRIRDAAIQWAVRWEGGAVDEGDELTKWEDDYARNPADTLGWPYLARLAGQWGSKDLDVLETAAVDRHAYQVRLAQNEFDATEEAPAAAVPEATIDSGSNAGPSVDLHEYGVPRPFRHGSTDIPTSQMTIMWETKKRLSGIAAWVAEEKRWICFAGPDDGWASVRADAFLETWVQDELLRYVSLRGAEWTEATRAKLTSATAVRQMVDLLRPRMTVTMDQINRSAFAVQVPGAAYCLRTGRKLGSIEHRDLVETRSLTVAPDESVQTPLFDDLLLHLACGDADAVEWLWAYLGYLLLGQPNAHQLLIITGPGGNGKGTLGRILSAIFGSYGVTLDRTVITEAGAKKHETGLYATRGKRFWYIDELDKSSKWNEAQMRGMTGGSKITVRGMGMNMQTFDYEGSILITSNFIPDFYQVDEAIARRIRILNARMKPQAVNRLLDREILDQEAPGIVARMIREARACVERGTDLPKEPACMQNEAARFFADQDTFSVWFEECASRLAGSKTARKDAIRSYRQFTREMGKSPLGSQHFTQRLIKDGFAYGKEAPGFYFYGVKLLPKFVDDFDDAEIFTRIDTSDVSPVRDAILPNGAEVPAP